MSTKSADFSTLIDGNSQSYSSENSPKNCEHRLYCIEALPTPPPPPPLSLGDGVAASELAFVKCEDCVVMDMLVEPVDTPVGPVGPVVVEGLGELVAADVPPVETVATVVWPVASA